MLPKYYGFIPFSSCRCLALTQFQWRFKNLLWKVNIKWFAPEFSVWLDHMVCNIEAIRNKFDSFQSEIVCIGYIFNRTKTYCKHIDINYWNFITNFVLLWSNSEHLIISVELQIDGIFHLKCEELYNFFDPLLSNKNWRNFPHKWIQFNWQIEFNLFSVNYFVSISCKILIRK